MSDDTLAHHGVPGMKWGKRKAAGPTGGSGGSGGAAGGSQKGFFNSPSVAKAVLVNSYGKKSAYTDPQALASRKKAGKLRIAAMLTAMGGNLTGNIVAKTNPAAGQIIQSVLATAASGLQVGATVNGAIGAHQEQAARKK